MGGYVMVGLGPGGVEAAEAMSPVKWRKARGFGKSE